MRFSRKTIIVGIAGTAAALTLGGVALAYWSTTGSGTGSATTSTGGSNLSVSQDALSGLAPGVAASTISGTITNNAANSAYVNTVTASISSVDQPAGATGTCDATDYTLASPTMTVRTDVAGNGGTVTFHGATLAFNDKATNQDGCKGATVNLAYVSN
ncbi:MAG: hypothetical protein ACRDWT_18525 [Jatrophihabitantaceae bacterium]